MKSDLMVKKETEREYKFLLDKKTFDQAKKICEKEYPLAKRKETMQVNYYYDNEKLDLRKQGVTLRVRAKNGKLFLQKKEHIKRQEGYSLAIEEEMEIEKLPATLMYKDKEYFLQGSLLTNRASYMVGKDIEIFFDSSFFLGIQDYEIEIEFKKKSKDLLCPIIKKLGLEEIKGKKGKASRFFKARKKALKETLPVKFQVD